MEVTAVRLTKQGRVHGVLMTSKGVKPMTLCRMRLTARAKSEHVDPIDCPSCQIGR